jgi:hypothetical protein
MNTFFDNNNKSDIGKLIHVGAGNGIELNDYVTQNFAEILLLEPIPKVFKQLESKLGKLNEVNGECKISALNVALHGEADTEKVFYITLPNRYSSLHKADKLKTLFQNLKSDQEITVSTINFSDLITKTSLDKDKKNALVLQINGAEFEVLAQAETDELMLFSSIVIQHSNNNYFEDAKTSTDLIAMMKSKGFQLAIETDNDVVFSSLIFRKDESTLKLKALTEQSKTQAARIGELETQLKASNEAKANESNKANASVEQSKTQAARIGELENQLKASSEAKASEVTEARAEARAEANASAEQSKKQAARIGELENQLKASSEAKASEDTEARAEANASAEQSKTQAARIGELETQLKASNEAKVSELTEARAEAIAKANASAEQSKTQAVRIGELENQLKASNEAKVSELTEARAEAIAKTNASVEQSKTQVDRIGELENQLKASSDETNNKQKIIGQLTTQKNELIESHNRELKQNSEQILTLNKQKDEHEHWQKKNKEWAESLNEQLKQLEVDYAEKSGSVNLIQKMLAKATLDLDSLRVAYSVKLASEKDLIALIKDLREKLIIASKYYFQLQQEHPELISTSNEEIV